MMPPHINYHKCKGCGACYRECPSDCYAWDEEKDMPLVAHPKECWHCGICEYECPVGAIEISLPPQCWMEINKRYIAPIGRSR